MPLFRRPVLAVCLALLAGSSAPAALKIVGLEPTVLFPKREPLAQIARLAVLNDGAPVRATAVVSVAGGATEKIADLEFGPNQTTVDVLVPHLTAAPPVRLELRRGDTVLARHEQSWQPQRKWKVYVVKASHEDIGYENYIFKKQKEIAEFIDLAREIARPRVIDASGTKKNVGYHYVMETILFQRNYLEERGERAWRSVINGDVLGGGRGLSLMAAPSGVHTHWMDYEQLARMSYPARREVKDRFGLDLKTAFIVDNPSLSWAGAQAFAAAGIKYVGRWGQSWRSGGNNNYAATQLPALFWWEAPDGHHRVLYAWTPTYPQIFWWGQTNGGYYGDLGDLPAVWVNRHLRGVEAGTQRGPYPYDALIAPDYADHETPKFDERMYRQWRAAYAYPQILLENPENFFAYIERTYGTALPTLRGDLNNFSADYSSIGPVSQDWKRRASRLLPAAEGLGVLASAATPGFSLLPGEVERTYTRMFDYDEHCWPTLPPVADEQLFNAVWVKNHDARRALDASTRLADEAAAALGRQIAAPAGGAFAVFNPLAHARSDLVEVAGSAAAVTDLRTNKRIPTEPAGEGRVRFRAGDVPAFGYALYRLEPAAAPAAPAAELKAGADFIENAYYTVRFHPENGSVTSIVDKSNGRELIDATAPYLANQLVYVHKNSREAKEGFEYKPAKAASLRSQLGRTQASFEVLIEDAKLGGTVHQTVTLHAGIKRVDFANRLESIDVMHSLVYEDRYRDNLYYAFPFAVAGGQIRAEQAGGVVRPYDDQLRWGSHDYLPVNRWIDVSNAQGGVTLATREASTFSLGEIRYNQFSIDYKPTKPWLFSYAWSNRMAGLLTLQNDDCNAEFHYSLTSHDGDWNSGPAVRHGWQEASPLLVVPATGAAGARWTGAEHSFLRVDQPNVQLTVLKASGQAGQGWIARFIETDGKATEFELDASALGVTAAALCNLVEDETGPLPVKDGKVRVTVKPFSFATVRLAAAAAPGAVAQLAARDVTDSAVRLTWSGPAGVAYNVYRSDDPGAPATAYSLVARTAKPELADTGLNLATKYYYRVAAVNAANVQGPVSAPLVVETSSANRTAPAPVHELGVVRRSADTLIVYWRKNPEPDVARYRVFRGETPDFALEGREPVTVLEANAYFLQIFRDTGLQPGRTYYYRVQPVDWADNLQPASPVAGATTPKDRS